MNNRIIFPYVDAFWVSGTRWRYLDTWKWQSNKELHGSRVDGKEAMKYGIPSAAPQAANILSVFCVQNRVVDGEKVRFRISQKHIPSCSSLTSYATTEQPPPHSCSKWESPSELKVAIHTSGLSHLNQKSDSLEVLGSWASVRDWKTSLENWWTARQREP